MRLLPRDKRSAIFDIYGFCRSVDDIADEPGQIGDRVAQLETWRNDIDAFYTGCRIERLARLSEAIRRYGLKRDDFLAVIDGMQMDVEADIRRPDLATLDLYCDRVASAVGRLCVKVFGVGEKEGIELADHLGRALQLTNILRDLDEDAAIGRLYLPNEFLDEAGIGETDPQAVLASPSLDKACRSLASLASIHFEKADSVLRSIPGAAGRAPRIMSEAYRRILNRLLERGWSPPRNPVRLSRVQVAGIVLRSYLP